MVNIETMRVGWHLLCRVLGLLMALLLAVPAGATDSVNLGVLSFRPKAETTARWQPLVDHLNRTVPGRHFKLLVEFYPEMESAIARGEVDFVLTQPAHYVLMTYKHNLSAPLATMVPREGAHALTFFGGVVFTSAGRDDIANLSDIRGKAIATSQKSSLGSYQMQAYQLAQAGVRLPDEARVIETGQPQDLAVKYVLEGRADVGFVRTGLLEQMAAEGKLDLKRLKIINALKPPGFPFLVSTRLYPEWPVAAMPRVDPELARQVTVALLALPHDGETARALKIKGFTIPADYHSVDDLLRELRLPPFDAAPEFNVWDVLRRFGGTVAVVALLWSGVLLAVAIWLWKVNRRLKIERGRSQDSMQRLEASETRHRAVLAALGEGVYGVDRDSKCSGINPAALAMLGYTEEEVLGRDQHELFHGRKSDGRPYPREECPAYSTARDGRTRRVEEWFTRKDGTGFPVDMTVTALHLEGQTAGTVVAFRDITDRKEAELALKKLYLAVEQSPESIIITDLNARIEYVNAAFIQNTGYQREDVIGQNPRILHSGETPAGTYKELWEALRAGRPWHGEFRNRKKDGSEYTEFAHVAPIRQTDGSITHYVAVKEDITEKKKLALELEQHRHHLEEMVASRTEELATAMLAAESANRAKSAFLANMSHEIRTPMNAIVGMSYLLQRAGVTSVQAERLAKIDSAAHHLLSILSDVLELSKIEAGKLELDEVDFALESVLEQVVGMISEQARAKGLNLSVVGVGHPLRLRGDATRLRQALLNYAGNAVKFTQAGNISLRVRILEEREAGVLLRFEVEDTGIGIPADKLARLFQSFEQVDVSTTRKYGGTGLGLAISQKLARLMGGDAGVSSEEGRGSLFWFTARLRVSNGSLPSPGRVALDDMRRHAGASVLLVEDNDVNREVALDLLRNAGLKVDTARDGEEALAKAGAQAFDLILMDVQMPRMDGLAATRAIRALPREGALPILAMTANAYEDDRRACLAAGMDDFVAKPVDPDALYATLSMWLPKT